MTEDVGAEQAPGSLAKMLLLGWMALVACAFVAVSLPMGSALAATVPEWLLRVRDALLPWFTSHSLY
jgi:hypothetical protein